ncbi:MAG: LysR family transcriptional regulator [Desulfobacterales bacterium]|nr:LysR family transcriptional regulator [Desulfobacterales bacterium]
MDVRLLRFFTAVYEERNFTAASKRCFVSQPSISTSIKQLEEEVGSTLFTRHKKGVDPTKEADQLYPIALRMLKDLQRLPEIFQREVNKQKFILSIMPDLNLAMISHLLRLLHERVGGLEFELVDFDSQADATLTLDAYKKDDEIFVPLWEDDYVVCVPPGHPFEEKEQIRPEDLHGLDFIACPPCEAHQQTIGLLSCSDMSLNIVARGEHKSHVLNLIKAGIGMSFLPTGLVEGVDGVVVRPYSGQRMFRRIGLAYPSSTETSAVLQAVLPKCQEIAERLQELQQ